ncbi:aspartyl-phosphate phosphatase Spo0E family protein [Neobacillus sp. MM2021_6]|uniref:aspartyl-phosphate phosphatase Spo0E family protein n=1 Tax=Bacillaceae TaxID=186817 RepID=UPI001408009C|nr:MULTISPECIES: aspartyl-phosphate phosphatase Spo0E family protein [Bacillaceae]MBO0962151.1 aspartyl-phosphate phosphatase Spo0E family protein [Neobacillus sp. MM2021_6]NHC20947.1 aspartyl-phosphate phosphatase Spo0E family protein [Bacillus sp. MM2020_4]
MEKKYSDSIAPIYFLRYMIEVKREELTKLFNVDKELKKSTIIQLSQELDQLINQYLKYMRSLQKENDDS